MFERDQTITNIKDKQNSHPTREKVSAFKNRVFSLLLLFVEKAKDTSAILPLLTEDSFTKDADHLRELLAALLTRDAVPSELLLNIALYYQRLLLFKHQKDTHKFTEDFVRILRKIKSVDEEQAVGIVTQMLDDFVTKRKSRLSASFFPVLIKRLPSMRQPIVSKGVELQQREGVRPAQQRVLEKMLKHLVKKNRVKQEEEV